MRVAILNYGVGNLASVRNALEFVKANLTKNCEIFIEPDSEKINSYDKIILPGVGAFADAMAHLKKSGMDSAILDFAKSGKFMIGICLGMQMLFEKSSEFGEHLGLGLINGEIRGFAQSFQNLNFQNASFQNLKIPHIGFNLCKLTPNAQNCELFKGLDSEFYLYFVHSFHALCADSKNVLATCEYGINFPSIVQNQNIFGIQPHPEKSQVCGLKLLQNFLEL